MSNPHPKSGKLFKPGVSGNPGGRPRYKVLSQAYRDKLGEVNPDDPQGRTNAELIADAVIKSAIGGNVNAIIELTTRVEGAARMSVVEPANEFSEMSDAELQAELVRLRSGSAADSVAPGVGTRNREPN